MWVYGLRCKVKAEWGKIVGIVKIDKIVEIAKIDKIEEDAFVEKHSISNNGNEHEHKNEH